MISDIFSETKMHYSDNIVRHRPLSMSAKTSDILRYFSHPFLNDDLIRDWSEGLIYFSGFTHKDFIKNQPKSDQEFTEIIALCPKWLLSASVSQNGFHTLQQDRDMLGLYKKHSNQSSSLEYFSRLRDLHHSNNQLSAINPESDINTFSGGLAGFIGYDPAAQQQITTQTFAPSESERLVAALGDYDFYIKKEADGWALYGSDNPALTPLLEQITAALINCEQKLSSTETKQNPTPEKFRNEAISFTFNDFCVQKPFAPLWSLNQYAAAFQRIQDYLRAGDCYQVNLTQPFVATVSGDLLDVMDELFQLTQAPYSGYMRVGQHELLSCSPELFLAFTGRDQDGNNQVITRPIKGTRPRRANTVQDTTERNALMASEKDRSENLMIVDLLRNDLSLHAAVGSVTVPQLFELESFAQVHHLVSEVRATLRQEVSALDVLIDALPGGSITGAPKKRAMEIIAELEAAPRGAYCGSFGFLNRDGSGQFNVLIRTLQKHQDQLVAWAGGGITIASEVEAEYQECFDKISAILNYVNGFQTKK